MISLYPTKKAFLLLFPNPCYFIYFEAFCTNGAKRTGKTLSSTLKLATESCKSDLNDSNSNSAFGTTTDKIRKRVNISRTSLILFDEVSIKLF